MQINQKYSIRQVAFKIRWELGNNHPRCEAAKGFLPQKKKTFN
jgi:hypothetical protein